MGTPTRSGHGSPPFGIVGLDPKIQAVVKQVRAFGPSSHPVLIEGESGTGKELVAWALHSVSGRKGFLAQTCASLSRGLAAATLFGHVKGAFTDANRDEKGWFRGAGRGTLFLDEIGDLPPAVQPMFLRALDPGEFSPVGSTNILCTQARVICATNRPLAPKGDSGSIRRDLYSRIAALRIVVPALRDRRGDIPLLVKHFLNPATCVSDAALEALTAHRWAVGNVRELQGGLEHASLLANRGEIRAEHFPQEVLGATPSGLRSTSGSEGSRRLEDVRGRVRRTHVLTVLKEEGGNQTAAAEVLGINRKTLRRWLRDWGMDGWRLWSWVPAPMRPIHPKEGCGPVKVFRPSGLRWRRGREKERPWRQLVRRPRVVLWSCSSTRNACTVESPSQRTIRSRGGNATFAWPSS